MWCIRQSKISLAFFFFFSTFSSNISELSTDLVAKTLGGDDGDFIAQTLVGLKVKRELGIVALDDDLSGSLDGLFNC